MIGNGSNFDKVKEAACELEADDDARFTTGCSRS